MDLRDGIFVLSDAFQYIANRAVDESQYDVASAIVLRPRGATGKITCPAKAPRTATILGLIGRKQGATVALMKATKWQQHSVRGFLSNLKRKVGVKVYHMERAHGKVAYALKEQKLNDWPIRPS